MAQLRHLSNGSSLCQGFRGRSRDRVDREQGQENQTGKQLGDSPGRGGESQDRDSSKGYRKDGLKRHFEGKINQIWYLDKEKNQR